MAAPAEVVIDTRPLWRILAGRTYRPTVLTLGLVAFLVLRAVPAPPGLSPAGQNALAIFALCLVYWVTNVLPLMVTSLLAMVLLPTTGEFITPLYVGGPYNQLFGNEIQAFFGNSPNWNYGAVLAISLIAVVLVLTLLFGRFLNTDLRESGAVTG